MSHEYKKKEPKESSSQVDALTQRLHDMEAEKEKIASTLSRRQNEYMELSESLNQMKEEVASKTKEDRLAREQVAQSGSRVGDPPGHAQSHLHPPLGASLRSHRVDRRLEAVDRGPRASVSSEATLPACPR